MHEFLQREVIEKKLVHAVSVVRGKITHYSGVRDYMGSMVSTVAVVRGLGYCVQKAVTACQ